MSNFLQRAKHFVLHRDVIFYLSFILIAFLVHLEFLMHGWLFAANDQQFHLQRIYELYQNIVHGNLNPLIATYTFNNNGNAVMSLYPKWPAYVYAVCQLITKNPINAIYFGNIIKTALELSVAFYSVRIIGRNKLTAYLFALLYSASFMIIAYDYQTMDLGAMWGLVWLPLIYSGFYKWIKEDKWVSLSIGLSGLLLNHILSFGVVIISLIFLTLFNFSYIKSLKKWVSLLKGAILTVLLSSLTWVPIVYFTFFSSEKYQVPSVPFGLQGSSLASIFEFSAISNSTMYLGLASALSLILCIINYNNMTREQKQLFFLSILFVLLQSPLVPWQKLQGTPFSVIQFPWRLLIVPMVCLDYLLVVNFLYLIRESLKNKRTVKAVGALGTVILVSCIMLRYHEIIQSQIVNPEVNYQITPQRGLPMQNDLHTYKITNIYEYQNMLGYNNSWDYYPFVTANNGTTLPRIIQHLGFNLNTGKSFPVNFQAIPEGIKFNFQTSAKSTNMELPFVAYDHHYQVFLDGHPTKWILSSSAVIQLNNVSRGKHNVLIKYQNMSLKQAMTFPSFAGLLFLILLPFKKYFYLDQKNRKSKRESPHK